MKITVAIPVGPEPHHRQYLDECLESVRQQTLAPAEVLIVDDMGGLPAGLDRSNGYSVRTYRSPWRLGVAQAFNFGVALAENEAVFMLGADDRLLPRCLERCAAAYEARDGADLWYGVGVKYSDGRPDQYAPCNAAMVTKALWRKTGGFPPEAGSGAPDAALISVLMVHESQAIACVDGDRPLYWYRVHEGSDTAQRGPWQGVILETRGLLSALWEQPRWGRFS